MAHRRVPGEHRVLIRPERGEAALDEAAERGECLPARGREPAWCVLADELDVPVTRPAVEIGPHLGVDVALPGAVGRRNAQVGDAAGRGLPVVVVQIPAAADGPAALHQQVVRPADPSVEVLLAEAFRAPVVRPLSELVVRHKKAARRQHAYGGQRAHQGVGRMGRGVVHGHRAVSHRLAQSLAIGVRLDVPHTVTELGGPMAHRGQDQVRFGAMEPSSSQDAAGLDHQQRGVPVRSAPRRIDEMRAELITEQPVRGAGLILGHAERSVDDLSLGVAPRGATLPSADQSARQRGHTLHTPDTLASHGVALIAPHSPRRVAHLHGCGRAGGQPGAVMPRWDTRTLRT